MNCITDFLPDDTSEHNADGENMDEIVFGIQPAPETLTPSELDAAVYGTPGYWEAMSNASVEAHAVTLERVKALEAENARLREVIDSLYVGKHGSIPHPSEVYRSGVWLIKKEINGGLAQYLMSEDELQHLKDNQFPF